MNFDKKQTVEVDELVPLQLKQREAKDVSLTINIVVDFGFSLAALMYRKNPSRNDGATVSSVSHRLWLKKSVGCM